MTFNIKSYTEISDFIENSGKNIQIVAISKNQPIKSIEEAISTGLRVFGENRVQEAINKFTEFKRKINDLELHLTGPLQTNKVRLALSIFDVFQTLDREKLAKEFAKYKEKIKGKSFFVQINTGKESNKSGVFPENADEFIKYCIFDLGIYISGLMCIPPYKEDPKHHFVMLKNIAKTNKVKHLSMGMSGDYKEAIITGASHIRIGTALFGSR